MEIVPSFLFLYILSTLVVYMDFLDRTGHLFSLDSFDSYPVGYEYQENPYVFWFNNDKSLSLSVDCWYFRPIRVILPINLNQEINFEVEIKESNYFYLLGSKFIQDKLLSDEFQNINDRITIYEEDLKNSTKLTYKSIFVKSNDQYILREINDDICGCVVENEVTTFYNKPYFTYNDGKTIFNGDIFKRGDEWIGNLKIGPLSQEVILERHTKEEVYKGEELQNDRILSLVYYEYNSDFEKNVEYTETTELFKKSTYFLIIPFYCACKCDSEGIFETNLLIHYTSNSDDKSYEEYCPITVGAEIVDENEALIINGRNMGVSLPKEILKAVYSGDYYSKYPDENLYAQKLKEYLLNFMNLKGQLGNYRSIIDSLKWFEWNEMLTINKLYKRDVELQNQYVRDYFDIINDKLYSYQLFKNTTLISITFPLNHEKLDENGKPLVERQELNEDFWGEGKPVFTDNIEALSEKRYDELDIPFYKGYYNYTLNELGLKLCALKYYYEKYFLPIHIKINSASLAYKVWMNDTKLVQKTSNYITEVPIFTGKYNGNKSDESNNIDVTFNDSKSLHTNILYINHLIDEFIVNKKGELVNRKYYDELTDEEPEFDYAHFSGNLIVDLSNPQDNDFVEVHPNNINITNVIGKKIKITLRGTTTKAVHITDDNYPVIVLENVNIGALNLYGTNTLYLESVGSETNNIKNIFSNGNIEITGEMLRMTTTSGHSIECKNINLYSCSLTISNTAKAKRAIKADNNIRIKDSNIHITTSGNTNNSGKTSAGLHADNIAIDNSDINIDCQGSGSKCVNTVNLSIYSGNIHLTNSGENYQVDEKKAKCIKADGNVTFYGGILIAKSLYSEAIEVDNNLVMNDGKTYAFSESDDAINIKGNFTMNDGFVYGYSENNDGVDCNGNIIINDGYLIGIGSKTPEVGIDFNYENGNRMTINGGVVMSYPNIACPLVAPSNPNRNYESLCGEGVEFKIANLAHSSTQVRCFSFNYLEDRLLVTPEYIDGLSDDNKILFYASSYNLQLKIHPSTSIVTSPIIDNIYLIDDNFPILSEFYDDTSINKDSDYEHIAHNYQSGLNKNDEDYYVETNDNPLEPGTIIEDFYYCDKEYNSFSDTKQLALDDKIEAYFIDDTALFVPINIKAPSGKYLDVYLELWKEDKKIHSTSFKYINSSNKYYKGLVVYPKLINKENGFDINYWIDKQYHIYMYINGEYYEYDFIAKLPEMNIQLGKLEYKYNDIFKQVKSIGENIDFNAFMYQPTLVTVSNIDFNDDILVQDISNYVNKYYKDKVNTINSKYLNRCHLINIFDSEGNHIKYNGGDESVLELNWDKIELYNSINVSEDTINLYRKFFNDDGSYKLNINSNYDYYLMHDDKVWYLVLISKIASETLNDEKFIFENGKITFEFDEYLLKYRRSDSKFLINRFDFKPTNGYNHFKEDDLIVMYLYNNDRLRIKVTNGSKWTIYPILNIDGKEDIVESNSELAIISLGSKSIKYKPGYYNVEIKYCIDDNIQHNYLKTCKFMVTN